MRRWLVGFVVLAMGCGGSSGSSKGGKMSAMEALGVSGPEQPWEQMSDADKEFYMVGKVDPIMKELFARHDAEKYADFSCEACHGEEMRQLKFKMPAPSMYIVPKEGTPGHRGMLATFPETVEYMQTVITPTMGTLLGIEATCATCHPSERPKKAKKKKRR